MKKKKFSKIAEALIMTVIGFLIGAAVGAAAVSFLPSLGIKNIIVGFTTLLLGFILHVFIHEFGHLVAGKMSGYGFVSIRFFNIIFIKKDAQLIRKKFNIAGTLGQCLMSPPEPKEGKYPFVLYNLGGGLMNFIFSTIFLALYFLFSSVFELSWIFSLLAFIGIAIGLFNILPLKMSGNMPNDGYNALTLGKDKLARSALWALLNINALGTKGVRFRDIPPEQINFIEETTPNNCKNAIITNVKLYKFSWLMDRHDFQEAKTFAENLLNTTEKMLDILKNELYCELLFLELIGDCRKEEIECLYDKNLKKYIKATSSYISRQRLQYAYAKLFLKDDAEATKALEKFNKICLSYPFEGEIAENRDLIAVVDDIIHLRGL